MNKKEIIIDNNKIVDEIQRQMLSLPQVECPVFHIFTKGLYTRQIFMPAGTLIVSKIHKYQHVFNISLGIAEVFNSLDESIGIMEAPFIGITEPGTRRLLRIHQGCIWTTFHPISFITGEENNLSDEEKEAIVSRIEDIIIEKRKLTLDDDKKEEISNE